MTLSTDLVGEIVDRVDGVPLFVEELTKAVLEQAEGMPVAALLATSPSPGLAVPPTLQASLVARLDRIGAAAREVAQVGAVLGRDFSYELIEPVAERPAPALRAALDQLVGAGLLFCRGVPPQSSYRFKHALVQDAAYGTLLRARRQKLHASVAEVLERKFTHLVERQPERVAHHLTMAGNSERAVEQWLKAAQHAMARLAYLEAIQHIEHGLRCLAQLPQALTRNQYEIQLQLARGQILITVEGYNSAAAAQAYTHACKLAEHEGTARQLFAGVYGLWQS